jgi:predicted transcriptional regulator
MARRKELGARQHAIMTVLWRKGEASVAEVHAELLDLDDEQRALTTVATMLSKMEDKGVVASRREGRQLVYRPLVSEDEVRRSMVGSLTDTLFGGRPSELVTHLLDEHALSTSDLERLRRLIEERARQGGAGGSGGSSGSIGADGGRTGDGH